MKNNTWAIVVGVIVILLAVFFIARNRKVIAPAETNDDSSVTASGNTPAEVEDVSTGSVHSTVATRVAYENALTLYKGSILQFDSMCAANPSNATWKNGTLIMLDNRSAVARTIHMGSMGNFPVSAWGFKIIKLSLTGIPTNAIAVDCDAHQNVALVTVQK